MQMYIYPRSIRAFLIIPEIMRRCRFVLHGYFKTKYKDTKINYHALEMQISENSVELHI